MNTRLLQIALFAVFVSPAVLVSAAEQQTVLYNFVKQGPGRMGSATEAGHG